MTIFAIICVLCLYLLPTIVAIAQGNARKENIIMINIFLGWMVVTWLGLMAVLLDDWKWWRGN
jgi:hypothetical protein